ncbi:hypothetical protein [Micromonospora sp. CPCC 205556]|uniref:hypothetical protein n=1 Tax=Micromonospora sp. CPCC 205556 TaxID=3122398 RepID=UPI002FF0B90D
MSKGPKPVPLAPRHRRDWWRWGRYCTCGLRWPCPDRLAGVPVGTPPPANRTHRWVGAAGPRVDAESLDARGRAYRANGGRR